MPTSRVTSYVSSAVSVEALGTTRTERTPRAVARFRAAGLDKSAEDETACMMARLYRRPFGNCGRRVGLNRVLP
eukprot:scaffold7576_cov417-Prasinococcus_capsulatus_cf.AAC.4